MRFEAGNRKRWCKPLKNLRIGMELLKQGGNSGGLKEPVIRISILVWCPQTLSPPGFDPCFLLVDNPGGGE